MARDSKTEHKEARDWLTPGHECYRLHTAGSTQRLESKRQTFGTAVDWLHEQKSWVQLETQKNSQTHDHCYQAVVVGYKFSGLAWASRSFERYWRQKRWRWRTSTTKPRIRVTSGIDNFKISQHVNVTLMFSTQADSSCGTERNSMHLPWGAIHRVKAIRLWSRRAPKSGSSPEQATDSAVNEEDHTSKAISRLE